MLRAVRVGARGGGRRTCVGSVASVKLRASAAARATHSVPADKLEEGLNQWTTNSTLRSWIDQWVATHRPSRIFFCDGSEAERALLTRRLVNGGVLVPLNPELRPNSYVARSPTSDVARVEERTFVASDSVEDAPDRKTWMDPEDLSNQMMARFDNCMLGRTMYVVPFCMGPIGSPFSAIGVQITDSPYVALSMGVMTRMGRAAVEAIENGVPFIPCVHSLGRPLKSREDDVPWPCTDETSSKFIAHFPEQRRIWSIGSGYGGNALLGKKCFALRIASVMARDEGWLAEHMLIVGITNPKGVKKYFAAAFPSACGKTNLAMMCPSVPGWKVETVGDDIAWMRLGPDGRLYAVNPEFGFFGVAPGTSEDTNPHAMETIKKNTIFTNVGITDDGDVWWEGMRKNSPQYVKTWQRRDWYAGEVQEAASHANARFTAPISQCPVLDSEWNNPRGVPIEGIIFGGRRSDVVPLVYQAINWQHGVYVGATMNSETTAAAAGVRGVLRSDPFAMKPFFGYNVGDYLKHWLSFSARTDESKLPKVFHVNWFRKRANKFLWPGFGDNIRVMKWIFERCDEPLKASAIAVESPIGFMPKREAIDVSGMKKPLEPDALDTLLHVSKSDWGREVQRSRETLEALGHKLPNRMTSELTRTARAVEME